MNLKLTVLCENSVKTFSSFMGEHGFACFIETDYGNYLLDTGQGLGIIHNVLLSGKNLKNIEGIVLSHGHWDHTGGLDKVLKITGRKKIYAHPDVFEKKYSEKEGIINYIGMMQSPDYLHALGAEFVLNKEMTELKPGIFMTGEIPRKNDFEKNPESQFIYDKTGKRIPDPLKDDNSMVFDTDKGLVILLGCAHAGLVNILDYVSGRFQGKNIYAIIGGTHLKPANDERLEKTIQVIEKYNIERIGVSHCTGSEKSAVLYEKFKEKFFFASVGTEFLI